MLSMHSLKPTCKLLYSSLLQTRSNWSSKTRGTITWAAPQVSMRQSLRLWVAILIQDFKLDSEIALDALMIWTHNLKFMATSVFNKCSTSYATVTLGTGVQAEDVVQFAGSNGFAFGVGQCKSVGVAGGWSMGGSWVCLAT